MPKKKRLTVEERALLGVTLEKWYRKLAVLKRKKARPVDIQGVEDRIKFLGGTIPKKKED